MNNKLQNSVLNKNYDYYDKIKGNSLNTMMQVKKKNKFLFLKKRNNFPLPIRAQKLSMIN